MFCETCLFFDEEQDATVGACRIFPPQLLSETYIGWPKVNKDDWCGEHTPVEDSVQFEVEEE